MYVVPRSSRGNWEHKSQVGMAKCQGPEGPQQTMAQSLKHTLVPWLSSGLQLLPAPEEGMVPSRDDCELQALPWLSSLELASPPLIMRVEWWVQGPF